MLKHFIILACVLLLALGAVLLWKEHLYTTPGLKWRAVDGRWNDSNGVVSVLTYGRGDLRVAGRDDWRNYTFSADLRYDLLFPETHYGDAGLAVRVSNASEGVDSYQGYYAGLRADDQMLMFGRADFGWRELAKTRMAKPIQMGEWYHLTVTAEDCHFSIVATDMANEQTAMSYFDRDCKASGGVGLRSFYTQSSWRNISIVRR